MVSKVAIPKVDSPGKTSLEEVKGKVLSKAGKEAMRTVTDSAEIFQLMEARDEQQMMQEIMGVYAKEYVYDIPFKGGKVSKCDTPDCPLAKRGEPHTHVRGLSWSGVKEARRIFKGIDTRELSRPVVVEQDGKKFYECSATAVDLRTGNCTTAFKRQPFLKKKKSGEYIEDEFAYEIVQSKAKRNSIAEILPQPLVRAWIQDWVKGKKDFNPKTVVDLKVGEYTVEDEQPEDKGRQKLTGAKDASGPQLNLIYAGFREIEKLGGRSFDISLTEWKKYFRLDSFKQLTLVQASKLIKTNIEYITKLKKAAAEKERRESSPDDSSSSPDRTKTLRAIKDALAELGWDTKDESLIQTLLSPYNLKSIKDLESADISVLQKILNDVGGGGTK